MGVTAGYFVFLFYLHFHVYTNLKITYFKFLRDEFEKGNEGCGDIKLNLKSLNKFKLTLHAVKNALLKRFMNIFNLWNLQTSI